MAFTINGGTEAAIPYTVNVIDRSVDHIAIAMKVFAFGQKCESRLSQRASKSHSYLSAYDAHSVISHATVSPSGGSSSSLPRHLRMESTLVVKSLRRDKRRKTVVLFILAKGRCSRTSFRQLPCASPLEVAISCSRSVPPSSIQAPFCGQQVSCHYTHPKLTWHLLHNFHRQNTKFGLCLSCMFESLNAS